MDKTKLLSQIPMFSGLHSSCIKTLSDVATEINVDKGKQVFAQGDEGAAEDRTGVGGEPHPQPGRYLPERAVR